MGISTLTSNRFLEEFGAYGLDEQDEDDEDDDDSDEDSDDDSDDE
jgi:hypothetical protein